MIITIGLEESQAEEIRTRVWPIPIVCYPFVPNLYSDRGTLYVESKNTIGKWLKPDAIIWYGYFPDATEARKAIALSNIPTFPDLHTALIHDDRALSLILANKVDPVKSAGRGFITSGCRSQTFPEPRVIKTSNSHCGEDKKVINNGNIIGESGIIEPFFDGESRRVLYIGTQNMQAEWILSYASEDWRKNVNSTTTVLSYKNFNYYMYDDGSLGSRAWQISRNLYMPIIGVDFIGSDEKGWELLEVNAYPGLEIKESEAKFIELCIGFIKNASKN